MPTDRWKQARAVLRGRAGSWLLLLVTIGAGAMFYLLATTGPAPTVIDLELARDVAGAKEVVGSWDERTVGTARVALARDFGFIALYTLAFAGGSLRSRRIFRSDALRAFAEPLAWGAVAAGLLDIIENVAMLQAISRGPTSLIQILTATAAWLKFALILLVGAYCLTAVAAWGVRAVFERAGRRVPLLRGLRTVAQSATLPAPEGIQRTDVHAPVPPWREGEWAPPREGVRIGICCSGGGIRSAAYNLGALQVLRKQGLLTSARYLAAVSGGAYIAGATAMTNAESDPSLILKMAEFAPRSPEEEYLRNHSSYIAPGLRGKARAGLQAILGLTVNVLFFWLAIFVVSRPVGWLLSSRYVHQELRASDPILVPATMWAPIATATVIALGLAVTPLLVRFRKDALTDGVTKAAASAAFLASLLLLLLVALPHLLRLLPQWLAWLPKQHPPESAEAQRVTNAVWLLQTLGVGTMALGALRSLAAKKRSILILAAGWLVAPLLAAITFLQFSAAAARNGPGGDFRLFSRTFGADWMWFVGAAAILFVFYRRSDQTTWSMHPFYKRRLSSAFALRRVNVGGALRAEPLPYDELQSLKNYRPRCWYEPDPYNPHACDPTKPHPCEKPDVCRHDCRPWPELVICAAVNVSDEGATPPGRNAVSFTFTSSDIGGPRVGWIQTDDMEAALGSRRAEDITLPAAIAVSGAAFSPAMGKMTQGPLGPLVALANLRLGVWLPHPLWIKALKSRTAADWIDRPRVLYLLKEIFGRYRLNDRFLYVTDGGHWENLGLVELLRRGCTEIYCFDASGDQVDTFFTLGEAVALARTELGVEITINPEEMKPKPRCAPCPPAKEGETEPRSAERAPTDHVTADFTYPNGVQGRLVFAKAAVTTTAPWDVRAYADKDPRFPTHSTIDQLYTDKKFEAYRALGSLAATNAIRAMSAP